MNATTCLRSLCLDMAAWFYGNGYDLDSAYDMNLAFAHLEVQSQGLYDEYASLTRDEQDRVMQFVRIWKRN